MEDDDILIIEYREWLESTGMSEDEVEMAVASARDEGMFRVPRAE